MDLSSILHSLPEVIHGSFNFWEYGGERKFFGLWDSDDRKMKTFTLGREIESFEIYEGEIYLFREYRLLSRNFIYGFTIANRDWDRYYIDSENLVLLSSPVGINFKIIDREEGMYCLCRFILTYTISREFYHLELIILSNCDGSTKDYEEKHHIIFQKLEDGYKHYLKKGCGMMTKAAI